jgi:hypothetical protein
MAGPRAGGCHRGGERCRGFYPGTALNQGLVKRYQQDAATRQRNHARMQRGACADRFKCPAALRHDSAGRETDIAIDHSEFTAPARAVQQVLALLQRGMKPR